MKICITILTILISITTLFAQVPEKISYQAVIRNNGNQLVINQSISMRVSILQDSTTATPIYVETHSATTNNQGLVSVSIGGGTAVTGTFSSINWANGPYFVKTETDPTGNTNYSISGISQLLSVPYALYAKKSGSASETDPIYNTSLAKSINAADTARWNNKQNTIQAGDGIEISNNILSNSKKGFVHYIGERFGGGIIFYLWKDTTGAEHGLIVSTQDANAGGGGVVWSNVTTLIGTSAQSNWDGLTNSNGIINQPGHTNSAAKVCLDFVSGGQTDWYLPSVNQLGLLWNNLYCINQVLQSLNGSQQIDGDKYYLSSTENPSNKYLTFNVLQGIPASFDKSAPTSLVRAIRPIRTF